MSTSKAIVVTGIIVMKNRVTINFDSNINSIVITLPKRTRLDELQQANMDFLAILDKLGEQPFCLLLDAGCHEFDSLEAQKYLREMLSIDQMFNNCKKFASVAPEGFIASGSPTDRAAVFSQFQGAYNWLKE